MKCYKVAVILIVGGLTVAVAATAQGQFGGGGINFGGGGSIGQQLNRALGGGNQGSGFGNPMGNQNNFRGGGVRNQNRNRSSSSGVVDTRGSSSSITLPPTIPPATIWSSPPPRPDTSGANWGSVGNAFGNALLDALKQPTQSNHNHHPSYSQPNYRQPSYYDSAPRRTNVQRNTAPKKEQQVAVKPNKLEERPAKTESNSLQLNSFALTDEKIRAEISALQDENQQHADALKELVDQLEKRDSSDNPPYNPFDYVNDPEKIENFQALADRGELRPDDIMRLQDAMTDAQHLDGREFKRLTEALSGLYENSNSIAAMQTANPTSGNVPFGNAYILLVPGLGHGQFCGLGNGTVLIGTGDPDGHTWFGTGNVAQMVGYPAGVDDPVPDSEAEPVSDGVVLVNAGSTPVDYNVNNLQYTMDASYRQTLPAGSTWTVSFDRGGSFGTAKYGLTEGTYKFTPTDKGWELFKHKFKVTIDNSDSPFTFRYVIDNRQESVAADEKREYSSAYPSIVRFDDGRGKEKRKRLKSGVYRVALSPDGKIDLYGEWGVAPPVKIADVIPPEPTPEEFFKDPKKATAFVFTPRRLGQRESARSGKTPSIFGAKTASLPDRAEADPGPRPLADEL